MPRHAVDLACGVALGLLVGIDLFTASSRSLVAYVQPSLVAWVQLLETRLSQLNLVCAVAVLVTWPFLFRAHHRRLTIVVMTLQTLGLIVDVIRLVASTLFGHQANPALPADGHQLGGVAGSAKRRTRCRRHGWEVSCPGRGHR